MAVHRARMGPHKGPGGWGTDSTCRRRRRWSKPARDISRGTPADNATSSATILCFLEPDPLALALCASTGPPVWVGSFDPMLEELAASLVVSRPMSAATPECLPTQATAAAPQEVEALVVDSPAMAAQ